MKFRNLKIAKLGYDTTALSEGCICSLSSAISTVFTISFRHMKHARRSAFLDDVGFSQRPIDHGQQRLSKRLSQVVIAARCTDSLLWTFSSFLGLFVSALQSIPLATNGWVYVTEPRPYNKTNENGDLMDTIFLYNAGYFVMCREHKGEDSATAEDVQSYLSSEEAAYQCYWNPVLTGKDLTEFSSATLAIEGRLALPTSMHIIGVTICYMAFYFGLIGHIKRSSKTLLAAIMYIFGGLVVLVGVLQFVCVVDDELAPRMKPNAAGEPSKFSFVYGYSFFFTSLSFLPLQMCACCHAFLYFRRFPTALDKMKIVPGLEAQLRRIQVIMALDSPQSETLQKGSICAIVYSSQPSSRKTSRYNLNSPLLIHSPVVLPPSFPESLSTATVRNSVNH
uniref:BMA-STG-2, isoform d n=3 Tax=Brugia malayi TaxID=6279 RepID=A0A1I9G4V4_BRUMA|nr:BMA-STG-2, isoform d [Brugia malayi]